jgi:uncharacterized protein YbaR (Trm112 family)
MPKCPICRKEMKVKETKKEQIFVCDDHGVFVPKTIFGVN